MRLRVGVLLVVCLARAALASPTDADRLIDEATKLAQEGKFVDAAARFRAAYAADPRPELVCNTGIAYFKAETELTRAQLYLSQCLTRGLNLDAGFVKQVRDVLVAIEDKLRAGDFTPVDVVVKPDGASVWVSGFAADESFVGSRLIWLPYGTHTLVVRMEGHVEQKRPIEATSRQQRTVQITLEPAVVIVPPPIVVEKPRAPERPSALARYGLPVAASVATLAAGGVALASYLSARDHVDAANAARTTQLFDQESADARSARTVAIGFAAGGALAGAAATYLWLRAVRRPAGARVDASAGPGGASLLLQLQF